MAQAILAQDYDGYVDWMATRDNPHVGMDGYLNVQIAYEKMRRLALAEKYSAVWVVESDTIPPPDALSKLLETQRQTHAEIVTGLYVLRHGANVPNLFSVADAERGLGGGVTWQDLWRTKGNVLRVSGGCMGCVLICPQALDFCFEIGGRRAPDMAWMRHNWKLGRRTIARLDVQCGHIATSGEILRPEDFLK